MTARILADFENPTPDNAVLVCKSYNSSKGDKRLYEWAMPKCGLTAKCPEKQKLTVYCLEGNIPTKS